MGKGEPITASQSKATPTHKRLRKRRKIKLVDSAFEKLEIERGWKDMPREQIPGTRSARKERAGIGFGAMPREMQPKRVTRGRCTGSASHLVNRRNSTPKFRGALTMEVTIEKTEGGHRPTVRQRLKGGSKRVIINKAYSLSLNAVKDAKGRRRSTTPNMATILH